MQTHIERLQKEEKDSKAEAIELEAAKASIGDLKRKRSEPFWEAHVQAFNTRKAAEAKAQEDAEEAEAAEAAAAESAALSAQLLAEEAKPKGPVMWDPASKSYVPLPDADGDDSWRRT